MNKLPENLVKRVIDPPLMMAIVIASLIWLLLAGLSVFAKSPHSAWENLSGLPIIGLVFSGLIAPWYLYDRGYQVGWDDSGVYVRIAGIRLEALFDERDRIARDYGRRPGLLGWLTYPGVGFMSYDDMASIDGKPDKRVGGNVRYKVRAALYISGKADPAGIYNDLIGLDFSSFKRESLLEFMHVLYGKRPELSPDHWVKQTGLR